MRYDESYIEYARRKGIPEPEANASRGNAVLALIRGQRLDEALARLDEITDPAMRQDLENMIEFDRHWRCIIPS